MADNDDTFSSDDESSTYTNTEVPKTYFVAPDNRLIDAPSNYDPKTGENLTIQKAAKLAPELKPVIMMKAPDTDTPISVPYEKINLALSHGLKPFEQIQAENAANVARQNVKEGNLGINPDQYTSFKAGLARGVSFNAEPQIVGAAKGLINLAQGGDYLPAYREGRDIEESANTAIQKANPKSYLGGELVGNTAQFLSGNEAELPALAEKIPLGSFGRNVAGSAAVGALSNANAAANKGEDVTQNAVKGAEIGGLGGAAGYGAGALLGLGGEIGKGLVNKAITPEAKSAFKSGLEGTDYSNPEVQEKILNTAANYTGNLKNILDDIRGLIGKQKETHLNSIGDVDHTPMNQSLENAYSELDNLESKTGDDEVLNAIAQAKNKVIGAMSTLEKNPGSALAIDAVKRDLAAPIYDTKGNFVSKSGTTNIHNISSILENARKDAQTQIENFLPDKIKGTNQAYKDILDAQNPQEAYDKVIPDISQTESLIKGNNSLSIRKRLNNLEDFNNDIQNNPQVPDNLKNKLNDIVNNYDDVINQASIVNKISQAQGLKPWTPENQTFLGAKVGTKLSPLNNDFTKSLQYGAQTINGVLKSYYDSQPTYIQNLIKTSPQFAQKLIQTVPKAVGVYGTTIERDK